MLIVGFFWQYIALVGKISTLHGTVHSQKQVEVVPKKISDDAKAGGLKNIIIKIPLWPNGAEDV